MNEEKEILELAKKHDWLYVYAFFDLPEDLKLKYIDKLGGFYITKYQFNSEEFIEKNADIIDWRLVASFQKLSEKFIEKHADKLNWEDISRCQVLSESFIEKHSDKLNWENISSSQELSEEFIERHSDKLNWKNISSSQELSEEFIERHADKLDWWDICYKQDLSEEFIERHVDEVDWQLICKKFLLSPYFIEKHVNKMGWAYIASYQKLSEGFIEKNMDKFSIEDILKHQRLSAEFLKRHKIELPEKNWMLKTGDEKLAIIKESGKYEINGDFVFAYITLRSKNRTVYQFSSNNKKILPNKEYEVIPDFNSKRGISCSIYFSPKKEHQEDIEIQLLTKRKQLIKVKVKIHKDDISFFDDSLFRIKCSKFRALN